MPSPEDAAVMQQPKICGACGNQDVALRCPCKTVYYCDTRCQKKSWKEHREGCTVYMLDQVEKAKAQFGDDHAEVGMKCYCLGVALSQQSKLDEAQKLLDDALRIYLAELGEEHPFTGDAYGELGMILRSKRKFEEALKMHKKQLRNYRATDGDQSGKACVALKAIGDVLLEQGKVESAMAMYREVMETLEEHPGLERGEELAAMCLMTMCTILAKQGRTEEAARLQERSIEMKKKVYGGDHASLASGLLQKGQHLMEAAKHKEALKVLEEGLQMSLRIHAGRSHLQGQFLALIAQTHSRLGCPQEAANFFRKSIKILRKTSPGGPSGREVLASYDGLCRALMAMGRPDEAVEATEEALAAMKGTAADESEGKAELLRTGSAYKGGMKDLPGAVEYMKEAQRIYARLGKAQDAAELGAMITQMAPIAAMGAAHGLDRRPRG
mmetsp:Transcript_26735/g.67463  ORF Transcript_26735/g.67463 Transcript_26735/m.67463 type:complete len:441 (+) Transcript_26735:76-1398(+)